MSATSERHKESAPHHLSFYVVTVSTSKFSQQKARTCPDDASGDLIARLVEQGGHTVTGRSIIPDNLNMIRRLVRTLTKKKEVDVIVLTGGTGVTQTDLTIEAITPLLDKTLPGFGELFRKISFEKIGTAAVLTRAAAGVANGKAIFSIPGSPDSVKTAVEQLILAESSHIVKHARER